MAYTLWQLFKASTYTALCWCFQWCPDMIQTSLPSMRDWSTSKISLSAGRLRLQNFRNLEVIDISRMLKFEGLLRRKVGKRSCIVFPEFASFPRLRELCLRFPEYGLLSNRNIALCSLFEGVLRKTDSRDLQCVHDRSFMVMPHEARADGPAWVGALLNHMSLFLNWSVIHLYAHSSVHLEAGQTIRLQTW